MNREEILERSRQENKNQDIYELEVVRDSGRYGALVATFAVALIFLMDIMAGRQINIAAFTVLFAILAGAFGTKAVKLRRKHEIFVAVMYSLCTLSMLAVYFFEGH